MQFANILDHLMTDKKISNYKMGRDLSISNSLISHWRKGKGKPGMDHIIAIAHYLDFSLDYLLTGKEHLNLEEWKQLTKEEQEVILLYRTLDKRGQCKIYTVLCEESDRTSLAETAAAHETAKDSFSPT